MICCSLCDRSHQGRVPFLCAVDARNRLYPLRVQNARALIENEELERTVGEEESERGSKKKPYLDRLKSEMAAANARTAEIMAQCERLKRQTEQTRKEVEKKKDVLARKESDLSAMSTGVAARRNRQLEETQESIRRLRFKWAACADTMASTRSFLCEEAARLFGLRQIRKGSSKRYELGGVEIIDLHALNSLSPEVINTSLANIAHLVMLTSHYLAIRLPSQITVPHHDYPRPTILWPQASYQLEEPPFPAAMLSGHHQQSGLDGPPIDVEKTRSFPHRPRPLWIEKPLPALVKEDPQTAGMFIEAVCLLAHNIAWACCTQGLPFGFENSRGDTYDELCNMGYNLYRLLIGDNLHRRSVDPNMFPKSPSPSGQGNETPSDVEATGGSNQRLVIGRWSHGTIHNSLESLEGKEWLDRCRLPSPHRMSDRLKKRLVNEAPMLEWEKIEGDELDDAFQHDDGRLGVLVKRRRPRVEEIGPGRDGRVNGDKFGMESVSTVVDAGALSGAMARERGIGNSSGNTGDAGSSDAAVAAAAGTSTSSAGTRGTSGWTKLKNR
ncbi:UV radiation resistance protein and autophagy-related subunit 14-domain-containing protein [Pseudoneurospora amorphoporcata]|uniref:Autophagy-related protein 14 n=1 Tax=Pseudoneurospora amorphoporcata TaxID=241081 RepID=A0AAN6NYJ8_9PEZI|nr:UV radiation resistance protein and autophagy-related subunit 14-domain-containing protein [Pseudoneurospora amorphoporcata]